jgi:LmbE family N-acetylglucosaminyl deacetylase
VIRSRGGDRSQVGRAARLAFGAMLAVAAFGCAGPSATVSPTTTPTGGPSSGTPVTASSASPQVETPTTTPTGGPSSGTPVTTSSASPQVETPTTAPTPEPTLTPKPTPIPTPTFNGHTTVFWVFAHPDDEALSSAGAMYESQEAGNKNVLITVTDGETTGVGPLLRLSLKQVAAAREKEGTAASAVIDIAPVFLREPETGGGVQQGFVEQEIVKLAGETKGAVVFEGLSPNDAYPGFPHGQADHYTVARALQAEFNKGVIKNLVFRHLANFSHGKRYGTCRFLSAAAMKAKQEMRAAYAYANPSIGRYGIAAQSVASMWSKTTTEPECQENVELHPGIDLGS